MFLQWLQNTIASKARNLMLKILAAGPIPKHIAFVMDGNRRYARMNHKEVQQGHSDGFIALRRVSRWGIRLFSWLAHSCSDTGSLPEVEHKMCLCLRVLHWELQTTTRGSRRSPEISGRKTPWTMSTWVKLIISKSQTRLSYSHRDLLDEHGVRLNVIGNVKLLPQSLQRAVRKAENMTRHNNR